MDAETFADAVVPFLKDIGLTVGLEPGRFLTGNGGILVSRVEYVKENPLKPFIVIDAAMNDLIRPALYQAHHDIRAVREVSETLTGMSWVLFASRATLWPRTAPCQPLPKAISSPS